MVPMYQSYAAESYLRSNRMDEALAYYHRLLQLDPGYGPTSWTALRPVLDPDIILHRTIDPNAAPETKLSYVIFLSGQGSEVDDNTAFRTWQQVVAENTPKRAGSYAIETRPFSFASAKPYLERLILLDKIGEADSVWHDLQRLEVVATPKGSDANNLIFNGDFEQVPLNAGFDWRWPGANTDLAIDFAAPEPYHGARCLRAHVLRCRCIHSHAGRLCRIGCGHNRQRHDRRRHGGFRCLRHAARREPRRNGNRCGGQLSF